MSSRTPATAADQLALQWEPTEVPVRFRLDRSTRERGLAHVAQLRAQLAARAAARQGVAAVTQQRAA